MACRSDLSGRRRPKTWAPLTLTCADECGRTLTLPADEHQDLSFDLALYGGGTNEHGRFTAGQFGPAWRCATCEESTRGDLVALLNPDTPTVPSRKDSDA